MKHRMKCRRIQGQGNFGSHCGFLLNHIDDVSLNSNPWEGNAPPLDNSWEPGKSKMAAVILVNYTVFIFTLQHAKNIILVIWHMRNSMDPFLIISLHFHRQIAKILHNLIDLCYIGMICVCPFLYYCHIENSTKQFPMIWKPTNIKKMTAILTENMHEPRYCVYS